MLERKLENDPSEFEKREIRTKLEIGKQSLEQFINYKTQGSIIRSRKRWYKGEKIQGIFFNLEKRHFNSKTIRNLKIDDNTTLNTDEEILNQAKSFHQSLYTSNNSSFQNVPGEDLFFQH